MARKTVSVDYVLDMVNNILKNSDHECADIRRGAAQVLENILHETGNYKGFRYLLHDEVPTGALPGVNYEPDERGNMLPCEDYTARFANTDDSRRQY